MFCYQNNKGQGEKGIPNTESPNQNSQYPCPYHTGILCNTLYMYANNMSVKPHFCKGMHIHEKSKDRRRRRHQMKNGRDIQPHDFVRTKKKETPTHKRQTLRRPDALRHSDTRPRPALSDERHSTARHTGTGACVCLSCLCINACVRGFLPDVVRINIRSLLFLPVFSIAISKETGRPCNYTRQPKTRTRRGSKKKTYLTYQADPRVAEPAIRCDDQFQEFDLADGLHPRPHIVT